MQISDASTATRFSLNQVLVEATARLSEAGIQSAELEAVWLLEKALHLTSLGLIVDRDRILHPKECAAAAALINRRVTREPLQYILGTQEFCGLEFEVDARVLIPRPESELLVRHAVQSLDFDLAVTIADIGTGSGCLAVSLAKALPAATIYALDLSEPALQVARRNIRRHAPEGRIVCLQGDLFTPLGHLGLMGKVDIIVSNPPYVTEAEWTHLQPEVRVFEPHSALHGGRDGTHVQRRLLEEAWRYLTPGGVLLMEMGWCQSVTVCDLAVGTGRYETPTFCFDEADIARVLRVRMRNRS